MMMQLTSNSSHGPVGLQSAHLNNNSGHQQQVQSVMNKKKKSVQLDSLSLNKKAEEPVTATAASRHQTAEKSGSNAIIT